MFRVLPRRAGIDRAVLGLNDDIGRTAIYGGVLELDRELVSSHDFIDEQRGSVRVEVGCDRGRASRM